MIDNIPAISEFIIYRTEDGKDRIEVRLQDKTVWLTLQLMADLFQSSKQNISHHINKIFAEGYREMGETR